jgi:acylphosphatase
MNSVHLLLSGRVQGVGFRAFARRQAAAHGVRGTVRNLADGRVEIYAAADAETLERFKERLSSGPSFGRVDAIDETPAPGFEPPEGFQIVY